MKTQSPSAPLRSPAFAPLRSTPLFTTGEVVFLVLFVAVQVGLLAGVAAVTWSLATR